MEEPDSENEADAKPKPTEECIWDLDLSILEGLEQYDDFRTDDIWELDLTALDDHNPNNVMNCGTSEGD